MEKEETGFVINGMNSEVIFPLDSKEFKDTLDGNIRAMLDAKIGWENENEQT